jgi:radical SAM protein with 4Fe4S-binding SPASM domain
MLITKGIAHQLSSLGINAVEISVYGRAAIHDAVTGTVGSFEKTMHAIDLLCSRSIHVSMKCPFMKLNFSERSYLMNLAAEKGVVFSADPTISIANDGGREALDLRLTTDQMLELMQDPAFTTSKKQAAAGVPDLDDSLMCSAGINMCGINPYGTITPCIQLPLSLGNIRDTPFQKLWHHSAPARRIRALQRADVAACSACTVKQYCSRCPGFALLEDGNVRGKSTIACELAEARSKKKNKKVCHSRMV